jgi:hypothetical protein
VDWKGTVRVLQADGSVIVSQGFSGVHSFDQGVFAVTPPIAPSASADAGYTALSTINIFRDWMYQPADLGVNTPVRMELRVTPFADAQHRQLLEDSMPENNVVNLWVRRTCSN